MLMRWPQEPQEQQEQQEQRQRQRHQAAPGEHASITAKNQSNRENANNEGDGREMEGRWEGERGKGRGLPWQRVQGYRRFHSADCLRATADVLIVSSCDVREPTPSGHWSHGGASRALIGPRLALSLSLSSSSSGTGPVIGRRQ